MQETEKPKESPLSFRIGGTDFTPGGFVDFENVFRTTNTGSNIATGFGAIPFSNTVQGHLTEFRSTGQYSRYNLKISGKYGANNVLGYIEGDFNGNDAANVFVTANGHTNRLRALLAGPEAGQVGVFGLDQTWGLQTPNRVGLSPMPADLQLTIGEDANFTSAFLTPAPAEFRAVYHFTDKFQWGFASAEPRTVCRRRRSHLPLRFQRRLGPQLDAANQTSDA